MRASDRAYDALLEEIQSGVLRPGAVLGEVEQAERLGVSRTPLREALRRLGADGLVVQRSPRVTVVSDIDETDIRELFEVRRALEESAARLAAVRGDVDVFAALALRFEVFAPKGSDAGSGAHSGSDTEPGSRASIPANLGSLASPDASTHESTRAGAPADPDAYYAAIADFDSALDAAVCNDYLTSALRTVRTHLVRVRRLARDNPARLAASATEHRLIARAIAQRDPDLAAHATHVHLHNALSSILATLDTSSGAGTYEGAA